MTVFSDEAIEDNRKYFENKLRAVKQKAEVAAWAESGEGDFVLLDSRTRTDFERGHIRGACCAPLEELFDLMSRLPKDRELVTYCWNAC